MHDGHKLPCIPIHVDILSLADVLLRRGNNNLGGGEFHLRAAIEILQFITAFHLRRLYAWSLIAEGSVSGSPVFQSQLFIQQLDVSAHGLPRLEGKGRQDRD